MKLVNTATATRVPFSRPSSRPIDEASMAQARRPCSTKARSPCCNITGSGVVRPVTCRSPPGRPMPSVPTTAAGRLQAASNCAAHQALEVLPLVPVMAITSSAPLGSWHQALAMGPAWALRPGTASTRGSWRKS